jgi:hypothetical protein
MLQRNEDGARSLETARKLASGTQLLQVEWYLGSAYARLGRTGDAIKEWRSVWAAGSVYAKESCEAVQRFKSPALP